MMIYWLLFPLAMVLIISFIGYWMSAPGYSGPVSDHFNGKKFINRGNVQARGFGSLLKWIRTRKPGPWTYRRDANNNIKPDERVSHETRITFINHTTFLIQTNGQNILTDPVYSERVSPFSFAGPKRMRPPGIRFENLPKIHVVLLSHNHYDHLDATTVIKLKNTFDPLFIVPLGVEKFLHQLGINRTKEIDWWQQVSVDTLGITGIPAQHFSGRGFYDRDKTLWCGYTIKTKETSICFVGDTGYQDQMFKEIAERTGEIDLAIIPIGAFRPIWFMSPIHCSPEEAVKIHLDLKSKLSVASHFGTFPLGDDGQEEPLQELKKALGNFHVSDQRFIALREGSSIGHKASSASTRS